MTRLAAIKGFAFFICILVGCSTAPPRYDLRQESTKTANQKMALIEVHNTASVTSLDWQEVPWGIHSPLSTQITVSMPYREAIIEPGIHIITTEGVRGISKHKTGSEIVTKYKKFNWVVAFDAKASHTYRIHTLVKKRDKDFGDQYVVVEEIKGTQQRKFSIGLSHQKQVNDWWNQNKTLVASGFELTEEKRSMSSEELLKLSRERAAEVDNLFPNGGWVMPK